MAIKVTEEMINRVMPKEDGSYQECPLCEYTGHWNCNLPRKEDRRRAIRELLEKALAEDASDELWRRMKESENTQGRSSAIPSTDGLGVFEREVMRVVIMYGSGFAGNEYYLMVGTAHYPLWKVCGGSQEDEKEARDQALRIMEEKHKDIPLDALEDGAKWDGSM